jgi:translation initiation factor IF-2
VTSGKIARNANLKLVRDGVQIYDGKLLSLRRFKDDAKEVMEGFECGIGIEGFNDIRVGDVIEAYVNEEIERKL